MYRLMRDSRLDGSARLEVARVRILKSRWMSKLERAREISVSYWNLPRRA